MVDDVEYSWRVLGGVCCFGFGSLQNTYPDLTEFFLQNLMANVNNLRFYIERGLVIKVQCEKNPGVSIGLQEDFNRLWTHFDAFLCFYL